ncbi:Polysaccharide biosynthesis protein [Rosistilla oblonga]|uniref:lipopolysaccharide biosynthesis protein n=1 Tax=Rosistilla oblonga TaxID=2527990 RepID=UPI00118D08BB|nr:lipopolysaccharide biosynthesis protein [Rosistilla oblonga]QDV11310.1 Polysaccharide biosynthesis protein [Rosistilla oblonga]
MSSNTFIKNVSSSGFASFAALGLGFASGAIAANLLGPSGRGDLASLFLIYSLVALIGVSGIDQAVALLVGESRQNSRRIQSAGLLAAGVLALLITPVSYIAIGWGLGGGKAHLVDDARIILLGLGAYFFCQVFNAIDQGAGFFGRRALYMVLPPAIYTAGCVYLAFQAVVTVRQFILWYLFGYSVALVLRIVTASASGFHGRSYSTSSIFEVFRRGARLHLPQLAWLLSSKVDMIVVIAVLSSFDVGLYAVAVAVAQIPKLVVDAYLAVCVTTISTQRNEELRQKCALDCFRMAQLLCASIGLLMVAGVPFLILVVFGAEFSPAILPAGALSFASLVMCLVASVDRSLRVLHCVRPGFIAYGTAALLMVCLGTPMAVRYGLMGVSVASALGSAISLVVITYLFAARIEVPWLNLLCVKPYRYARNNTLFSNAASVKL